MSPGAIARTAADSRTVSAEPVELVCSTTCCWLPAGLAAVHSAAEAFGRSSR
jgi:hypothetical protein